MRTIPVLHENHKKKRFLLSKISFHASCGPSSSSSPSSCDGHRPQADEVHSSAHLIFFFPDLHYSFIPFSYTV